MQPLTSEGQEQLRAIAQRYGVSTDAAATLLDALQRGSGSMAQFNHPELGGYGQWMRGGMIMIGDMFNNGLKASIDGLCNELGRLLDSNPFLPVPTHTQSQSGGDQGFQGAYSYGWWPGELGQPSSSGAQNDMRYAYFPATRRLAIDQAGVINVYDTLDHQIGGVSQQQGSGYSLSFSSQYGSVDLRQLPLVSTNAPGGYPSQPPVVPTLAPAPSPASPVQSESESDVFAKLERLGALKQQGVITDEEFAAKKAELLSRI
jgi:hypothetical protein